MNELRQKLKLWQARLRSAKTPVLREIAGAHVEVYEDVIRRRTR